MARTIKFSRPKIKVSKDAIAGIYAGIGLALAAGAATASGDTGGDGAVWTPRWQVGDKIGLTTTTLYPYQSWLIISISLANKMYECDYSYVTANSGTTTRRQVPGETIEGSNFYKISGS